MWLLPKRRRRGNAANARDAVDLFFDRFGNLAFNNIGIGAGVVGVYRNNGRVNGRVIAHSQISETHHTKKNDDQVHNGASTGRLIESSDMFICGC